MVTKQSKRRDTACIPAQRGLADLDEINVLRNSPYESNGELFLKISMIVATFEILDIIFQERVCCKNEVYLCLRVQTIQNRIEISCACYFSG